jgi:HlyD family secretion protein
VIPPPARRATLRPLSAAVVLAFLISPSAFGQTQGPVVARGRLDASAATRSVTAFTAATSVSIAAIHVREGERVAAGQLLATLATAPLADAAVAVAEAAVAVAERRLEQARRPWRDGTLQAARATVAARAADLDLAERRRRRTEDLLRRSVRSDAELDERMAERNRARALLAEAEAQLDAVTGVAPADVRLAEAELQRARAQLVQASAERDLTRVRAPIAGTVLRLRARAGDGAVARPILDLADLDHLRVLAEIEERAIARVRVGQHAEVGLPAGGDAVPAEVVRIGHQVRIAERAQPDLVTGAGGRMIEVELQLTNGWPLPPVIGLELVVRIAAP